MDTILYGLLVILPEILYLHLTILFVCKSNVDKLKLISGVIIISILMCILRYNFDNKIIYLVTALILIPLSIRIQGGCLKKAFIVNIINSFLVMLMETIYIPIMLIHDNLTMEYIKTHAFIAFYLSIPIRFMQYIILNILIKKGGARL